MQAFEVGHFWSIACFSQGFEAGFDQFNHAAAQYGLFAEEVGFGFFAEVGFNHAAFGTAVGCGVRQGDVACFAAFILVNGDQRRYAAAFQEFAAYGVAWALGATMITSRSARGTIWL